MKNATIPAEAVLFQDKIFLNTGNVWNVWKGPDSPLIFDNNACVKKTKFNIFQKKTNNLYVIQNHNLQKPVKLFFNRQNFEFIYIFLKNRS